MTRGMSSRPQTELSPHSQMQQMIIGFWIPRALYAAAKFGIADVLRNGPKTIDELAVASGTHGPSLFRLMRALASIGVFACEDGRPRVNPCV